MLYRTDEILKKYKTNIELEKETRYHLIITKKLSIIIEKLLILWILTK